MNEILNAPIPLFFVAAGILCVVIAITGRIGGKIEIIVPPEKQRLLGVVGILFLVIGLVIGFILPNLIDTGIKQTSTHPITSTPATTTPPTPTSHIIDEMNDTWGWKTYREDNKSSINITSIVGRTGNAIEISYDLKEKDYVLIYKEINPEILFGKKGIKFFYKASGGPNMLTIGLEYEDSTKFISSGRATVTDNWVPVEVLFHQFKCENDEEYKAYGGESVDLKKVCIIVFIIWNCPEQGNVYGSGKVIIDDVQGITS